MGQKNHPKPIRLVISTNIYPEKYGKFKAVKEDSKEDLLAIQLKAFKDFDNLNADAPPIIDDKKEAFKI